MSLPFFQYYLLFLYIHRLITILHNSLVMPAAFRQAPV